MNKINHCLYPVAGLGTRFLPITKSLPKELLPIIDKPLLQYAVEEAHLAGIMQMNMVVSDNKKAIQHYFSDPNPHAVDKLKKLTHLQQLMDDCDFHFVKQKEMRGLGDAILCGNEQIKKEEGAFAVILPDDLCAINTLKKMVELYQQHQCCIIAVEQVPASLVNRYGIVEVATKAIDERVYKVFNMVEKPPINEAKSDLAIIGRYILTTDIFDFIKKTKSGANQEIQITDALKMKAQRGEVIAYHLPNKRYDCGTPSGYVKAIKDYAAQLSN
jgi:UTP--glucose-1-phosphate uridylyltransferase